ncbi:MAG: cellulase family glycosylhydrolase [Anaerolineae bacterium]|nr:cellulase family glycosylhydrolase [Anaerolineae bacterium]
MLNHWSKLLLPCALLCLLFGCTAPIAEAELPGPTHTPTPTVTPTATPTETPTPTPTPTAIPTIVIPMLTPTITPTVEPTLPVLWDIPERVIPEPFGIEIHFTQAGQQELDYITRSGVGWVRMDMFWHIVETELGKYNFAEYDTLVRTMTQRGIRIIFILDYGNSLYDLGYAPVSPGGQASFARFAAVAANRYRDKGIIWEIWNEPNLDHFWTPKANASDYGQLALRTAAAIRRVDPSAIIVAPALCGFDWNYWHTLGQMGLFKQINAVTFHGYGVTEPEKLLEPYMLLRTLVNRYQPAWQLPILSGEWGFSTTRGGMSEGQQAQYLARQWLFNLSHDINLSIWYDWHDDGPDPYDPENNYGIVHNDYTAKPAYRAASTLLSTLDGYRFLRRVPLELSSDYLLLFENGKRLGMALWTTGGAHTVVLPVAVDEVEIVEMTGETNVLDSDGNGLAIQISQSPRYLLFRENQITAELGGWRPYDTINLLNASLGEGVRLVFENHLETPRYGNFEIRAQGTVRGTLDVMLEPETEQQFRIPIDLTGLQGTVVAEVRFIPENNAMLPLQSAEIWLQIIQTGE